MARLLHVGVRGLLVLCFVLVCSTTASAREYFYQANCIGLATPRKVDISKAEWQKAHEGRVDASFLEKIKRDLDAEEMCQRIFERRSASPAHEQAGIMNARARRELGVCSDSFGRAR